MKNKFNPLLKSNIQKIPDNLTDIDTRSHTALTDIGTNTHAQIDTALGTTIPGTYLKKDGSTPLTASWDAGSFEVRAQTLQSDIANGTSPMTIASTTKVTNLNADLLDGLHDIDFARSTSGTINYYVDITNGIDDTSHGLSSGAGAYATLTYCWSQIPAIIGGNVIINVAAGSYRYTVDLLGKNFSGAFSITIQGETSNADTGTATSGANLAGNGSAGFGTITNTNKNYGANAHIRKWIEITGGLGLGQLRCIHSNTATVITIEGRWDIVPDNTSVYRIFTLTTIFTGANAGAETTNVRKYCIKVTAGQKGINLKYLEISYGGLLTWDGSLLVDGGAECNCTGCYFQGGWFWQCLYIASATGYFDECVWYNSAGASIGDLRVGSGAFVSRVYRCRLEGNGNRAINPSVLGSVTGVKQTYISNVPTGLYCDALGFLETDAYLEIDGCATNNILCDVMAVIFINAQEGATTTQISKNSGGWGAISGGKAALIAGASTITYSGNASGTYTPTTSLAGQTT